MININFIFTLNFVTLYKYFTGNQFASGISEILEKEFRGSFNN